MKNYFTKKQHCYTASEVMIAPKKEREEFGMCLAFRKKNDWRKQYLYAFTNDTERAIKWLNIQDDDGEYLNFVVLGIDL